MHAHMWYTYMYISVSLCFICAEISVLWQSSMSRVPCAYLGQSDRALCEAHLWHTRHSVLQNTVVLGKSHHHPVYSCMLSVNPCACLWDWLGKWAKLAVLLGPWFSPQPRWRPLKHGLAQEKLRSRISSWTDHLIQTTLGFPLLFLKLHSMLWQGVGWKNEFKGVCQVRIELGMCWYDVGV